MLVNAFQHGSTAGVQFAQITQPEFEFTQLNVVKPTGGFLAVARDKRHGRTAIEQFHCGFDLMLQGFDFCGNLAD